MYCYFLIIHYFLCIWCSFYRMKKAVHMNEMYVPGDNWLNVCIYVCKDVWVDRWYVWMYWLRDGEVGWMDRLIDGWVDVTMGRWMDSLGGANTLVQNKLQFITTLPNHARIEYINCSTFLNCISAQSITTIPKCVKSCMYVWCQHDKSLHAPKKWNKRYFIRNNVVFRTACIPNLVE